MMCGRYVREYQPVNVIDYVVEQTDVVNNEPVLMSHFNLAVFAPLLLLSTPSPSKFCSAAFLTKLGEPVLPF